MDNINNVNIGINEKIITGRKWRRLIDKDAKLWQRISWWTKADDVEFNDGKTAEEKVGNINGITSDFSVNSESISASSNLTNRAYNRFQEFTDDGKIKRIIIGEDGKPYIEYEDGADTVLKKLGNGIGGDNNIYIPVKFTSSATDGNGEHRITTTSNFDIIINFEDDIPKIISSDKIVIQKYTGKGASSTFQSMGVITNGSITFGEIRIGEEE